MKRRGACVPEVSALEEFAGTSRECGGDIRVPVIQAYLDWSGVNEYSFAEVVVGTKTIV